MAPSTLRLLLALWLPSAVDAFGGLHSTSRVQSAADLKLFRDPAEMPTDFGWDQTGDDPLKATAVIGNTRYNVWKWERPPP